MKEKLVIKNFGPIKDVTLELGRFNVLIGENATGKSTVAKLLAVCRYFSYIAMDNPVYAGQSKFSAGLSAWGLSEAIKKDSYIFYKCKHYSLTVEQRKIPIRDNIPDEHGKYTKHDSLTFLPTLEAISEEFNNLLSELKKILSKPRETDISFDPVNRVIPYSFFQNDVAAVMDNPFYLYTERGLQSIFSLGKDSIPNIADSLYNYFTNVENITGLFKNDTDISLLNITYRNENGIGKVRKISDNEFYDLKNAASGYKSAIPIVLVIEYYNEIRNKKKTFIIEEPELNLFPEAQQKLMQYLVDKIMNYGNSILITTHSPYTLTSLNNLMYAYQVGENKPEEVNRIIDKKFWVNPEQVNVYRLMTDGTAKNIVSKSEDGTLIEAEEIDEVSRKLNKEFDELIELEIENEAKK